MKGNKLYEHELKNMRIATVQMFLWLLFASLQPHVVCEANVLYWSNKSLAYWVGLYKW